MTIQNSASINLPDKLRPVFEGDARYRASFGGRGSGKTRTFALMTAVRGYQCGKAGKEGIILCAREHLNSLDESSLEEVKAAISSVDWLKNYYEVGERYIRSKDGRINYSFAGLRRNVDSLKSRSRILICWVDEAENVSESAWQKLIPTVRQQDSEIWVTWNPESKQSATHRRFRETPPDDMKCAEMNWRDNPWFPSVLQQARLEDKEKRPDIYPHVWEGDFRIHVEGSYYATEMLRAQSEGRICAVPYDRNAAVVTAWDLGMADTTSIWFAQYVGKEIRIIDYYENSGMALDHYTRVLADKGYAYDQHILPHDVRVKELGTGLSRYEVLQNLGLSNVTICPMVSVEDGIQQVRSQLDRCWFDETRCERGVDALRQYRRDWDDVGKAWRGRPLHDWTSHPADAFRYLAVGYAPAKQWGAPIRRRIQGIA
jgi:phage terminase large subunit